jgi:hypothetical protein
VAAKPPQRLRLQLVRDRHYTNTRGALDGIEEGDRVPVARPATQMGPGLAADVVRGDQPGVPVVVQERDRVGVVPAFVGLGDPVRGVDEDHR